jgi:putative ABC transport system substrate-binding protein
MERRTFIAAMTGGLLAAPLVAEAQQAAKVWRIGVLVPAEPESATEPNVSAFRQGLRDLGYFEGQNITVEYRYAHGKAELYPSIAAELAGLSPNVIVVGSGVALLAAKKVTQTIPIVGVGMGSDPVGSGLVRSLARPGGNITGESGVVYSGFAGKWVELLRAAVPNISRVGYVHDPGNPVSVSTFLPEIRSAAHALTLKFLDIEVRDVDRLDSALATISRERRGGLIVHPEALFFPYRDRIAALVAKYRLPAIYGFRLFVDAGGLMSYAYNLPDQWRRAAHYVDKILKGANPADLPVGQPTKFELVINLKTAKALGLTIPPALLQRADQVIE